MLEHKKGHIFWTLRRCTIANYLLLAILCTLGYIAYGGRPRTLKKCGLGFMPLTRIVGGKWAIRGEYPWMVTVHEYYYGFMHVCGGAILNERWIITAAHCIDYPKKPKNYEIYVGVHRLSQKHRKGVKKHEISKVIVHEGYKAGAVLNDIALLRTKKPIDFKGSRGLVNGICLPKTPKRKDPIGWATVTGWGYNVEGGVISDVLKAVKVPIVPRNVCNEAYDDPNDDIDKNILDTQLCAGASKKDSCQNDSGGPLVKRNKKGVHTLIGVVSYGAGCGDPKYPGVYTNVAKYMDWLYEKTKD